jgi:hypothetical protein
MATKTAVVMPQDIYISGAPPIVLSGTAASPPVTSTAPRRAHVERKEASGDLDSAIYTYIQAMRALGRTSVTVEEVARGLSIAVADVYGRLRTLRLKGVKTA